MAPKKTIVDEESLELMQDKEFMASLKRAKKDIKNRDFAIWDDL